MPVNLQNLPLYKTHQTVVEPTFQQMTPEEKAEKFGTIEETSTKEIVVDKFKRAMNLISSSLFGDIPFIRKLMPEHIRETVPELPSEKVIQPIVKVGRDIGIYSKAGKIVGLATKGQYASRAARIIYKTGSEAFKGAVVGATTAGTEDPIDIAKKAGVYGGLAAGTVPAVEALSFAGSKVVNALGKSKALQNLGEWAGLRLRENEVNNLVRKRYGEINSKLIDSAKYIDDLGKQLSKEENKSLAYIIEAGDLNSIPDVHIRNIAKSVRQYLDNAHKDMMKEFGNDIGFIENYVPHIWDIPKNKEEKVINWFITRNPHLKQRRVETIEEGIKKFGLTPKYDKITDILSVYDQIRIKSAANLKFVKELANLQDDSGVSLMQRVDKAPADWPIVDHYAVRRAMMVGKTQKQVPIEDTTRIVTESLEKIKTIERTIPGGGTVRDKGGAIKKLEDVMVGALESRGMTTGEANAYIGRLKSAYAGADVSDAAIKEKISEDVKRTIGQQVFKLKRTANVDVPILSKVPVRVHPSIYPDVKAILDNYQPGKATQVLDTVNTFVKQSVLNLSLFHHMALTETGIAIGAGKEAIKAWNPVKIIRSFKNGTYKQVLQQNVLAKEAVMDGLEVGAIADVEGARHLVTVLKKAEKSIKSKILETGIKATVRKPLEFNNKFLWDYLHTTYKLNAYSNLKADMIKKFPNKNPKIIGQEVAQFVNDTFGGQPWEILSKSKEWQQFSRYVLLSPDWVLSTMKQALSPFGVGATSKAGVEIRKEMGNDFWRRALIYFGGSMNMLNYAYTKAYKGEGKFMWENSPGKETYLFTGYNADGTERYLRWGKQFRELAEAIKNPTEVAGRKISPLIRITKHQVYPSELWQKEIAENPFWSKKGLVARSEQLLKDVTPYSLSQQQRIGEFSPLSFVAPISRGMTPYNVRKYFKQAILSRDKNLFEKTYDAALENEIDPDPIFKQALSSIKSEIKFEDKREAKKLFINIRKIKNKQERLEYVENLDVGDGVKEELLKIVKGHASAIKKRKKR